MTGLTWRGLMLGAVALVLVEGCKARAGIILLNFNASLTSGSLAGTQFTGSFSYDSAGITGGSHDFLPLVSFDFDLLGVHFARANISQGGQAIFENGVLVNETAAFFANSPAGSPVSDIAF